MEYLAFLIPKIRRAKVHRPAPGALPGTVAPPSEAPRPTIRRIEYDADRLEETDLDPEVVETSVQTDGTGVVWIDVQGVGDAETIRRIGTAASLHPLTLEDIAHAHGRPKLEEFDDYVFVSLRAVRVRDDAAIDNEHFSFVLKDNLLITFQERPGDGLDPVRKRLREAKGTIRRGSADYLLYALMDVTIDNYFPVIELYGDTMENLEDAIRDDPRPELSQAVHTLRRELRQLRRTIWPLRDLAGTVGRSEIDRIDAALKPAFRDCYDHVVQLADFVEGARERAADLADLYATMVSEKTNQVMKVLTIIATIFIPLTFLCGVYGMNFDPEVSAYNMPELGWRFGYPALWGVMIVSFVGMLWFFVRKGWIGSNSKQDARAPRE